MSHIPNLKDLDSKKESILFTLPIKFIRIMETEENQSGSPHSRKLWLLILIPGSFIILIDILN